jgi:hypothetical protein
VETARTISTNPEVLKRLAKYLAQQCFRNTMLEDRIRPAKHTIDEGREASLEIVRPVSASGSKLWV